MSEVPQGPGWWQAGDGRWYPPEALAEAQAAQVARAQASAQGHATQAPAAPAHPGPSAYPPGAPTYPPAAPAHHGPSAYPPVATAYPPGAPAYPPGAPIPAPRAHGQLPGSFGGQPAYGEAAGYPPFLSAPHPQWERNRAVGTCVVLIGLAGLLWGIGLLYNALAASNPVFPHDEQVGLWIEAVGVLLGSCATIGAGVLRRRP